MSGFQALGQYTLVLNDQTPLTPSWLSKFPNKVEFQPGLVAAFIAVRDIQSQSENAAANESVIELLKDAYFGKVHFLNLISTIRSHSQKQLYLKLLLGHRPADPNEKREVLGWVLCEYVGDQLVAPLAENASYPDICEAIKTIRCGMVAKGLMTQEVSGKAQGLRIDINNLGITRPDNMDFRA